MHVYSLLTFTPIILYFNRIISPYKLWVSILFNFSQSIPLFYFISTVENI